MTQVKQDLEAISGARVLMGHRSVGRDVLAGVRTLAAEAGVPLRIETIDGLPPDAAPGLFHSEIGKNGDPETKCEVFANLLDRPEQPQYDIAMMKFCYEDMARDTPLKPDALLERYSKLVASLKEQRPDVSFVHITVPLRADWTGWKVKINRVLGRDIPVDADNALRNAYNDGLRQRFGAEPIFDIAQLESTRGDGSRSEFEYDKRIVYTLAPEYTHDGGHLNEQGQRLAAAEFLRTLATTLEARKQPADAAQPTASAGS